MIKDFFGSLFGDLQYKVKSPFYGTLLIVLLYRNWKLIYTIFNLNPRTTLEFKIGQISEYLPNGFWDTTWQLVQSIGVALLLIVFGYLFTDLTKFIRKLFDKYVTTWFDKKSKFGVTPKEVHERLQKSFDNLEKSYGNILDSNRAIIGEREELRVTNKSVSEELGKIKPLSESKLLEFSGVLIGTVTAKLTGLPNVENLLMDYLSKHVITFREELAKPIIISLGDEPFNSFVFAVLVHTTPIQSMRIFLMILT